MQPDKVIDEMRQSNESEVGDLVRRSISLKTGPQVH